MVVARDGAFMGHAVFFTLKEPSKENIEKCVSACREYLSDHEGTVFFACGTRAADYSREVNDKDFHVSLHLVFRDSAAHDKYQDHPQHIKFIAECKDLWAKVRVFDDFVRIAGDSSADH